MKNHHKIFVKCRSGRIEVIKALHQVDGGPLMGAQGGGGGAKRLKNIALLTSGGQINS